MVASPAHPPTHHHHHHPHPHPPTAPRFTHRFTLQPIHRSTLQPIHQFTLQPIPRSTHQATTTTMATHRLILLLTSRFNPESPSNPLCTTGSPTDSEPKPPPVHPPQFPPKKPFPRSFVAVQGVVYCKSCKYAGVDTLLGASPVLGATIKLQCNNTKYPLVVKTNTDKNGYFFITAPRPSPHSELTSARSSSSHHPLPLALSPLISMPNKESIEFEFE
ncbi:Pollen Ole e 1 allergen and extensin family protein [Prunus dulcis]|uniref:Pollen Ole e 1 allergen and extensin family protein n=1 Tax=Prunus dulcis TaxID=3755 RepID=A0A4Y1R9Q0_PRUDU|nr:Pollen Ole e 1 allergen and extensin family protein [Prunus dulcis]